VIVVGVDGSRASADALRWALAEARRRAHRVLLVHAGDAADPGGAAPSTVVLKHQRFAGRVAPDVDVSAEVVPGAVADVLIGLSPGAELVVVGGRGRASLARSALGSISQQVALHAECPVVVVPEGSSQLSMRRIAAEAAEPDAGEDPVTTFAEAEAERWGATLFLVRPLEPPQGFAAALLAAAADADLAVVGCRHSDEEFGCRIGTVPATVLAGATCPVALIGRDDRALSH
jgi:nucleotide-binding universal stress UspA family protein